MRVVCLVGLLSLCFSPACATLEKEPQRFPVAELPATSAFVASLDARAPIAPAAARSKAVALYESGDPPLPIPEVAESYHQVCADPDRTRERRRAYDNGDDVARRQDCYCADAMPCSANRDCADLVVCYPQIAQRDTSWAGTGSTL
jgi:hypothetical protein